MLENMTTVFQVKCGLVPGRPVLAGVSGGPDSLCLLETLQQEGYTVLVAHFDHQLRPDSDAEVEALRAILTKKDIPFLEGKGDVLAFAKSKNLSVEEAARMMRYTFLFEQARAHGAQAVAVGHTADDQVETVLMNFVRGAGLNGLRGMEYRSLLPDFDKNLPLVRPLLDVWREETIAYCAANNLKPYLDPSNESLAFTRNRIRHNLIPNLESFNPRFRDAVLRTSKSLAGDYNTLKEILESSWAESVISEEADMVTLYAEKLTGQGTAIQRNLIRRALAHFGPDTVDIRFSVMERATEFLSRGRNGQIHLTGGLRMFREGERVYIAGPGVVLPTTSWPQMPETTITLTVQIPGQVSLSNGWQLVSEKSRNPVLDMEQAVNNVNNYQAWLDADTLPEHLEIRARRPGDRFEPIGMDEQSMKLSDFFINEKIPQRARDAWPLICSGDTVVWIPGYRLAHPFRLTNETEQIVYFKVSKPGN